MKILTLDPGNSTGWCFKGDKLIGGTLPEDHNMVALLILELEPDVVVYESFKLYPGKAKSLAWNSFYPCEVIGVIKYVSSLIGAKLISQDPYVKKYAGGFDDDWHNEMVIEGKITEHVKDAYLHLKYFERNNKKRV